MNLSHFSELYEDFGETKKSIKDHKDDTDPSDNGDSVNDKIESHEQDGSKAATHNEKFVKKDLQGICSFYINFSLSYAAV